MPGTVISPSAAHTVLHHFTLGSPSLHAVFSLQSLKETSGLWESAGICIVTGEKQLPLRKEAQLPGCTPEAPIRQMLAAAVPRFSRQFLWPPPQAHVQPLGWNRQAPARKVEQFGAVTCATSDCNVFPMSS